VLPGYWRAVFRNAAEEFAGGLTVATRRARFSSGCHCHWQHGRFSMDEHDTGRRLALLRIGRRWRELKSAGRSSGTLHHTESARPGQRIVELKLDAYDSMRVYAP